MARNTRDQLGVDLPEPEPIEPAAEATPDEPSRPEWLPEKFKSEEEFATSYRNLEAELSRRSEETRNLEAQISELATSVESLRPQQQQGFTTDQAEQLQNAYDTDPLGTMAWLANQAAAQAVGQYQSQQQQGQQSQQQLQAQLIANNANQALAGRYEDWADYGPKIGDAIQRDPSLMPMQVLQDLDGTVNRLDQLYKQVKFDDLAVQLANGNGSTERAKIQAQTNSGSGGRQDGVSDQDEKMARLVAAAKNNSYAAWRG